MYDLVFNALRKEFPTDIDDAFIEQFIANNKLVSLKKHDILVQHKTIAREVHFVVEGSFMRNVITYDNEERTVMFNTPEYFNFMVCSDSYVDNIETEYHVVANEDSLVLEITRDYLRNCFSYIPFSQYYAYYLEQMYMDAERTRDKRLSLSSEEYLIWLYQNFPFLFRIFPSKSIASFMGITPVWFSNLKRKVLS